MEPTNSKTNAKHNKNSKRLHVDSDSSDNEPCRAFPRFIVLESAEEAKITDLSPFVIQKVISSNIAPKTVKTLKNKTLLVEVEKEKHANFLLGMNTFHNLQIRAYPHKNLNTSKGVVRSKDLSVCTIEEIKKELNNQGIIDVRRISIKKENQTILTNTYIMQFDRPTIPKEIKIGYNIEKVEPFIPNPLRCFKCQKFGHHEDACNGRAVCGRCGRRDPDHTANECRLDCRCANCGEDHPAYARACKTWKKEKEIMAIKHTKNISFPEARKMVDSYMKEETYSQITSGYTPSNITNQNSKYEILINKLLQLGPNDWPKFINEIKPTLSTNITHTIKSSNNASNTQNSHPKAEQSQRRDQYKPTEKTNPSKTAQATERDGKQPDTRNQTIPNKPTKPTTQGESRDQNTKCEKPKNTSAKQETRPRSTSRTRPKTTTQNKFEVLESMEVEEQKPRPPKPKQTPK